MNPGTAALSRGLDVLVALAEPEAARAGLGVAQLTELIGADKSQLSRTLATLDEQGFVARDSETLTYRLGWRLFSLAARSGDAPLIAAARPVLLALVAEFGESAHLSVRLGDQVLTLATESPISVIHAPGRVGGLTPLATTSAGRALVVDLPADELERLGLASHTAAIGHACSDGYAIVREEFEPGLVSVAAPIRGANGTVIGAINVSAPSFRFDDRLEEAAPIVVEAAAAIGLPLGSPHLI
ncbi:MAG: IclR family transcriptional regulator [Thermoleophilia bacterium]|nr:IclR family transcriptional regulator [Thermoleophilia bacterium]